MADAKRERSRAASKIEDPIQLFTNQMQQQTIAIYGFPFGLQLLAYRNISGLLDKILGSSDERTFLEWHSIGIPKNNLSLNEVHLLERVLDLDVVRHDFAESVKKPEIYEDAKISVHKFSRSRQSTCPPSRKVRIAAKHPIMSKSPGKAAVDSLNIRTPPSSPLTSMHEEENAVSGQPAIFVDDITWRQITSQKMNSTVKEVVEAENFGNTNMDSVTSPQNYLVMGI
ncbi:predicted protein [Arabidopsis lyrata subsp. lyrata]|uniref:Predicted protein n=1 Tax=Arabidopsis lyrata subsp. lyrata TaxID=81972 RepID=D7KM15_ARALL|nr:predicted protein [Arabidopsis lyrata subsp. lyrata]